MADVRFRDDINGLRALAVSAVVLFHFKFGFVPGGFTGVDIFFVISGYLMTLIITRKLEKGSFSLIGFYGDRTKRIVPPLYAMIFSLFVFSYVFIDPYSYQKLASTGISALLFFSNFRFWEATGYFDAKSTTKWLLHTWSLSVEWQFYLIYPIILMSLSRFVKAERWRLMILWSLTIASLLACIAFSTTHPASTFYLLPFRAWEMLAGGLVAAQFDQAPRDKRISLLLLAIGLILIAFACFTFNEHRPWPYYWAVIPVGGTCLVIAARRTGTILFANPICRFLGEWSYSIYLWHWPIVVGMHYFDFKGFQTEIAIQILIMVMVIGVAIYLAATLRPWLATHAPRVLWAAGACAIAVAVLIAANDGLPGRVPGGRQLIEDYEAMNDWTYPERCWGPSPEGNLRPCHVGEDKPDTLFIGDSFAMQLYPYFADMASKTSRSFTFVTAPGCPAILGVERNNGLRECSDFMEKAFSFAESGGYRRVVLVSGWSRYFGPDGGGLCFLEGDGCTLNPDPSWYSEHVDDVFARTTSHLAAMKESGKELIIVATMPFSDFDIPIELVKRKFLGRSTDEVEFIDRSAFEKQGKSVRTHLETMAKAVGAAFVDPLPHLCDAHRCPMIDPQGVSLFIDAIHYRSQAMKSSRFGFLGDVAGLTQAAR